MSLKAWSFVMPETLAERVYFDNNYNVLHDMCDIAVVL